MLLNFNIDIIIIFLDNSTEIKLTFFSLILDVSDDFISYLKADGVVLPKG